MPSLTVVDVRPKPLLDLAQHRGTADACDQQAAGRAALDADRRAGADPVFRLTLDPNDLVVRNLDANLVASFAAVQPEAMRVELQAAVEGDAAASPKDRIARHARIMVGIGCGNIRTNHPIFAAGSLAPRLIELRLDEPVGYPADPSPIVDLVGVPHDVCIGADRLHQGNVEVLTARPCLTATDHPLTAATSDHHISAIRQL
jgi:hypothetical protein